MTFVCGAGFVWSSPFIPKLNGKVDPDDNPLPHPTTPFEDSLITSLHLIGAMCSPFLTGPISDKFGKKKTLLASIIFPILSNIIIIFANSVVQFYVARFLLGLGTGCVFSMIPIYTAEISDTENRGTASFIMPLMNLLSQLLVFILGPYVSITTFAIIYLLPAILYIFCFGLFAPESSYNLILNNQWEEAKSSLMKLRGRTDVDKDIQEISLEIEQITKTVSLSILLTPKVKHCLIITLGLLFFQQFSGVLPIQSNMQSIFESAGGSFPAEKSAMLSGVVSLFATVLSTKAVDLFSRKCLLIISYVGILFSLFFLGLYFYLQENGYNTDAVSWLPTVTVLIFLIFFCIAAGPLPWTIIGELFPVNLKAYLSSVTVCFAFLMSSILTFIFPLVTTVMRMSVIVWIFTTFVCVAIIFIICYVPETKGKTLQEIQFLLEARNSK